MKSLLVLIPLAILCGCSGEEARREAPAQDRRASLEWQAGDAVKRAILVYQRAGSGVSATLEPLLPSFT